jgi:hypothetical protein
MSNGHDRFISGAIWVDRLQRKYPKTRIPGEVKNTHRHRRATALDLAYMPTCWTCSMLRAIGR